MGAGSGERGGGFRFAVLRRKRLVCSKLPRSPLRSPRSLQPTAQFIDKDADIFADGLSGEREAIFTG